MFAEIFGIVDSIIPSRTQFAKLLHIVLDKNVMVSTNLDIVVKVKCLTEDITTGMSEKMIVNRDSLKPVMQSIKKTKDIFFRPNLLVMNDAEQHLDTITEDKYPEYESLAGMDTDYRLLFSTSDIHLTETLIDRMLCMAKGIANDDYRPGLLGYIFDPAGHFIYTTNGHILFGTDYSSVADKIFDGEGNPETFTMMNIEKILRKVKKVNTVKVEDTSEWVRFTIYCDYYTIEIMTRKVESSISAEMIREVIPVESGDNNMILSSESIDSLVRLFGKVIGGVKFQKIDDDIVCTSIGEKAPAVYRIHDTESKFEAVGFNINYIKAISDFYRCSMMELNFADSSHAARANIFDNDDIAIVMPIRLPNEPVTIDKE